MASAIIFVPVMVALVSFYVAQRVFGRKNRLLRKMYDSQVKFLKYQVRKLENEKTQLNSKLESLNLEKAKLHAAWMSYQTLTEEEKLNFVQKSLETEHKLLEALKDLNEAKKSQGMLQRRLDSDIVSFQERDDLVDKLQKRIKELESAYWAQKDESDTLEKIHTQRSQSQG